MDLSQATAHFGLSAKTTGTRHGVTWKPALGISVTAETFPDSDILRTFLLTGITSDDVPSLDLVTGVVTPDGTATVSGGSSDFEGAALESMASVQGVLLERLDDYPGLVTVSSDADSPHTYTVGPMEKLQLLAPAGALFTDPVLDAANLYFTAPVSNPPAPISMRVTLLATAAP
jgi:hypothetical protein